METIFFDEICKEKFLRVLQKARAQQIGNGKQRTSIQQAPRPDATMCVCVVYSLKIIFFASTVVKKSRVEMRVFLGEPKSVTHCALPSTAAQQGASNPAQNLVHNKFCYSLNYLHIYHLDMSIKLEEAAR